MLQIKRLKALRRGKRQNRSPNQDHDAMSKKGLSRRCSCAVYIIEETLCTVIRKIMSSHVNDQTVCTVQSECPLICKALAPSLKSFLSVWKPSENINASLAQCRTDGIIYPVSSFSQIFLSFTPLWVSGSSPISPQLPGPIPGSPETGGRVVISDSGRWSWLIDSTSDGTRVTSSSPIAPASPLAQMSRDH